MQAMVSELDFDFAGYAEEHFARLQAAVAGDRLSELIAAVS